MKTFLVFLIVYLSVACHCAKHKANSYPKEKPTTTTEKPKSRVAFGFELAGLLSSLFHNVSGAVTDFGLKAGQKIAERHESKAKNNGNTTEYLGYTYYSGQKFKPPPTISYTLVDEHGNIIANSTSTPPKGVQNSHIKDTTLVNNPKTAYVYEEPVGRYLNHDKKTGAPFNLEGKKHVTIRKEGNLYIVEKSEPKLNHPSAPYSPNLQLRGTKIETRNKIIKHLAQKAKENPNRRHYQSPVYFIPQTYSDPTVEYLPEKTSHSSIFHHGSIPKKVHSQYIEEPKDSSPIFIIDGPIEEEDPAFLGYEKTPAAIVAKVLGGFPRFSRFHNFLEVIQRLQSGQPKKKD